MKQILPVDRQVVLLLVRVLLLERVLATASAAVLMVLLAPGALAFVFGWFAFKSRVTGVYLSIITQMLTYALWLSFFRNDFGFGGNNATLIFSTAETVPQTRPTPSIPAIVTGLGIIAPEKDFVSERAIQPPLPPDSIKVRACGALDVSTLTPNQRRRRRPAESGQ